jgi:hypothetical protein
MTEVQDTGDPKAERLRNFARGLALAWAALASLISVAVAFYALTHGGVQGMMRLQGLSYVAGLLGTLALWLILALLTLVPWVSVLVAWEWEVMGGILLIVLGVFSVFLCVGILPLAAGILFLASCWILGSSGAARTGG